MHGAREVERTRQRDEIEEKVMVSQQEERDDTNNLGNTEAERRRRINEQ